MLTAAFLLAFFGFLRVSKFTILSRSRFNTQIHPAKASVSCKRKYYTFTIKASKTDQLQRGHKIYILRSHEKFCPYSAMQKYIGHFLHSPTVGAQPLFTFRDGSPLTRHSCLKRLRRFLHMAGYLPQDFNTHSTASVHIQRWQPTHQAQLPEAFAQVSTHGWLLTTGLQHSQLLNWGCYVSSSLWPASAPDQIVG